MWNVKNVSCCLGMLRGVILSAVPDVLMYLCAFICEVKWSKKEFFEITRQFSSGSSSLDYGSIAIIRNIRNYSSVTRCHVPEDLTLQQNCCEILISCPAHTCFKTDWKMSNSKIKHNFIFKCACGYYRINHLNTKSNPICHLLALLGAHPILHVSRIRVNNYGMFVAEERVIQIGM